MTEEQIEPGQRLTDRLFRRASRRHLIGPGSSFYKRFGFADPLAPAEGEQEGGGFVFLSGASYYEERDAWLGKYADLYARLGFFSGQGRTAAWLSRGSAGVRSRLVDLALAGLPEPVLLCRHDLDDAEPDEPEEAPSRASKRAPPKSRRGAHRKLHTLRELLTELGPRVSDALLRSFEAVALEQASGGDPVSEARVVRATLKRLPAPIARSVRQRLRRRAQRRPDALVPQVDVAAGRASDVPGAVRRGLTRVIRTPRQAARISAQKGGARPVADLGEWLPAGPVRAMAGWEDAQDQNWEASLEPLPVPAFSVSRAASAPEVVWLSSVDSEEDQAHSTEPFEQLRTRPKWASVRRVAERAGRPTLMDLRGGPPGVSDTSRPTGEGSPRQPARVRSIARAAARAVPQTSERVDLAASPVRSTRFDANAVTPDLVLPVFLQSSEEEGEQWVRASAMTPHGERRPKVSASRHAASRQTTAPEGALVAPPVSVPSRGREFPSRAVGVRSDPAAVSVPHEVATTVRATRRAAEQVRRDRRGRAMVSPAPLAVERRASVPTSMGVPDPVWLQPSLSMGETVTPAPIRRAGAGTGGSLSREPKRGRRVGVAPAAAAVERMGRVLEPLSNRSVLPVVTAQDRSVASLDRAAELEERADRETIAGLTGWGESPLMSPLSGIEDREEAERTESPVVRAARRGGASAWVHPAVLSSPVSYLLDPIPESELSWVVPEEGVEQEVAPAMARPSRASSKGKSPSTETTPTLKDERRVVSGRPRATVRASQRALTSVTRSERGLAPRVIQSESLVEPSAARPSSEARAWGSAEGSREALEGGDGRETLSPLRRAEIRQRVAREETGSPMPPPFAYLDDRVDRPSGAAPVSFTELTAEASYRVTASSSARPMARAAARSRSPLEGQLLSASPLGHVRWPQGLHLESGPSFGELPLSVKGEDGFARVWASPQMVWGEPSLSRSDAGTGTSQLRTQGGLGSLPVDEPTHEKTSPENSDLAAVSPSRRAAQRLEVARGAVAESEALLPRPMAYVDTWSEPEWAPSGEKVSGVEASLTGMSELPRVMPQEEEAPATLTSAPRGRSRERGARRGVRPSRRAHARLHQEASSEWGWRDQGSSPEDRVLDMVAVATEERAQGEGAEASPVIETSQALPTKRSRRLDRAATRASSRGEFRVRKDSRGKTLLSPAVSVSIDRSLAEPLDGSQTSPTPWAIDGGEPLVDMPERVGIETPLQRGVERGGSGRVSQIFLEEGGEAPPGFSSRAMDRASNPVGLLPSVQRAWGDFDLDEGASLSATSAPRMQVPSPGAEATDAGLPVGRSDRARQRKGTSRSESAQWTQTPLSRWRPTSRPRGRQDDLVEPALVEGAWDEDELDEGVESPVALAESRLTERGVQRVVRKSGSLLTALARARDPEDVVRAILERSDQVGVLGSVLPNSATRLVERIALAGQPSAADDTFQSTESVQGKSARGRTRASRRRSAQARTGLRPSRVYRGSMSTPSGPSDSHQGMGANHVMKLAGKLMNLIHLAENERRMGEAQAHVRMAEDTDSARAEGSMEADAEHADAPVDITTLKKTVLDSVMREIELLQARREDPDGNQWW